MSDWSMVDMDASIVGWWRGWVGKQPSAIFEMAAPVLGSRFNGSLLNVDGIWYADNPDSNAPSLTMLDVSSEEEAKAVALAIWRMR